MEARWTVSSEVLMSMRPPLGMASRAFTARFITICLTLRKMVWEVLNAAGMISLAGIGIAYGTAFRDPNFVELSDPRFQSIQPEKITSYELVYEQGIGKSLRSSVSGYYDRMDNLIDFENGSFTNFNAATLDLELALEGKWENGIRSRLSYTLQHTEDRDTHDGLPDSPLNMIKFNTSVPLLRDKIFAGLEVQYTGRRQTVFTDLSGDTLTGADAPGYAVVNFTLFSQNLVKNLEVSASVYNLLGETYYDPASLFHQQAMIQQDGRTFRVKVTYRF